MRIAVHGLTSARTAAAWSGWTRRDVRTALQDAASIASLLITTEAMIAERPEKKAAPAGAPGGGMGGMGDMDF